jgi:hypothetical protein
VYRVAQECHDRINARIREERFVRNEENNYIRKLVRHMENNQFGADARYKHIDDMKTLKRMINLVTNHMQIRFMKGHFLQLQEMIKEELRRFYSLNSGEIKVNPYGLTGAGVYFQNSCLKLMVRIKNAAENFSFMKKRIDNLA